MGIKNEIAFKKFYLFLNDSILDFKRRKVTRNRKVKKFKFISSNLNNMAISINS